MATKLLIVDDEPLILKGLRFSLEQDGYQVDEALDGEAALEKCAEEVYDLVLLDVMLPKLSGMDVLRTLRENSDVPVIMLTAKGEDMDKILGLEYGADDYMVKPFNILEVKARIRTVLRRAAQKDKHNRDKITIRDIQLDTAARSVLRGDREINVTVKEFNLLHLLMANAGKVYSRENLLKALYNGPDRQDDENKYDLRTVDVHIRRLREKLEENPARPKYIMTKWGVGYYFADR